MLLWLRAQSALLCTTELLCQSQYTCLYFEQNSHSSRATALRWCVCDFFWGGRGGGGVGAFERGWRGDGREGAGGVATEVRDSKRRSDSIDTVILLRGEGGEGAGAGGGKYTSSCCTETNQAAHRVNDCALFGSQRLPAPVSSSISISSGTWQSHPLRGQSGTLRRRHEAQSPIRGKRAFFSRSAWGVPSL